MVGIFKNSNSWAFSKNIFGAELLLNCNRFGKNVRDWVDKLKYLIFQNKYKFNPQYFETNL
jgi:hypothetical protein